MIISSLVDFPILPITSVIPKNKEFHPNPTEQTNILKYLHCLSKFTTIFFFHLMHFCYYKII